MNERSPATAPRLAPLVVLALALLATACLVVVALIGQRSSLIGEDDSPVQPRAAMGSLPEPLLLPAPPAAGPADGGTLAILGLDEPATEVAGATEVPSGITEPSEVAGPAVGQPEPGTPRVPPSDRTLGRGRGHTDRAGPDADRGEDDHEGPARRAKSKGKKKSSGSHANGHRGNRQGQRGKARAAGRGHPGKGHGRPGHAKGSHESKSAAGSRHPKGNGSRGNGQGKKRGKHG